ncbi:unnamed protein product [Mytilus edulis]|uniref:Uncharacterized protein n=1 Tax=Mytilus edulis TaxID=6550 RepID=A0A8S3UEV8_MYTED|nr:unnamed protein product [Mytilus edulis]
MNNLTLICKVNSWNHRIFIDNQFGRKVADCIPDRCDPYDKNASMHSTTNDITFSVNGKIDNKVNGNWTCRHGTNLDIARVEVTVLKDGQQLDHEVKHDGEECSNKTTEVNNNCPERNVAYTFCGFVLAVIVVWTASNWITKIPNEGYKDIDKNAY